MQRKSITLIWILTLLCLYLPIQSQATQTYWDIEVLVNGDENCPPKTPEPLNLRVKSENSKIEGLSFSVKSTESFLQKPFAPTEKEQDFLKSLLAKEQSLFDKSVAKKYEKLARKLFVDAFQPQLVKVGSAKLVVKSVGQILIFIDVHISNLIQFSEWYSNEFAEKASVNSGILVRRNNEGSPEFPLLIYGTVLRGSETPPYDIEFSPDDTVITANVQNEEHDSTLCQLREGLSMQEKADIAIYKIISITK